MENKKCKGGCDSYCQLHIEEFKDQFMTITRIQGSIRLPQEEVNIRIIEGGKPIDIRVGIEDFAKALFGDILVNCRVRKNER